MGRESRARRVASAILGLIGAGLTILGAYLLLRAFLPDGGAYALSVLFAPLLVLFGILILAAARAVWLGTPGGRTSGITVAAGLGAIAFFGAASALGWAQPGGGGPGDGPPAKAAAAAQALRDAPPPGVDPLVLGLWLLLAVACLAVILLLWFGWAARAPLDPR